MHSTREGKAINHTTKVSRQTRLHRSDRKPKEQTVSDPKKCFGCGDPKKGIYHDPRTNSLHFDTPELLAHLGLPDTPENRDIVTEQAMRVAAEEFPNASRAMLTARDNDPD